jgi:hypothetical protein
MRTWMAVWLLPVGMLGGVVLISLGGVTGYLLAALWGIVLFPHGAAFIRRHTRGAREASGGNGFPDEETDYWRITLR